MKTCQHFELFVCLYLLPALSGLALPAPGDEHWDSQFGPVGTSDPLYSVVVSDGKVYVGGRQTAAGNTRTYCISGFDGTGWFALNNGINLDSSSTAVYALAADQNYLYAGGWFTNADNSASRGVARWDRANWSAMGTGLNGYVFILKKLGTNLYAGGIFSTNSGTIYHCLARWTETAWAMVPGEFTASGFPVVHGIESDGTNIYVAGTFSAVAGINANNVARWDGKTWSALGSGISGSLETLFYKEGILYAGGAFTNAGASYTNTARWDGTTWSPWANANRAVRDILTDGTNLYVGGDFTTIANVDASRIAKWDGLNWSGLGAGVQGFGVAANPGIYKMTFDNGRLYVVGNFNAIGGVGASYVACWNGNTWEGLGGNRSKGLTHFIGNVSSLLPDGNRLYAGGAFTEAGDQVVNSLACWDGANWSSLGGLTGSFSSAVPNGRALARIGSDLYVGGTFTNAGGVGAKGVARWDGHSWWPLAGGVDYSVRALATDGAWLYVGGNFTNVNGMYCPAFAIWTGAGWLTPGAFSGGSRAVYAIAVDGTDIYVGGNFTAINGVSFANIARWNGSAWLPLGSGTDGSVISLAVTNGILYAGGSFTFAGGVLVNRIAKWNGTSWSALGSGISVSVSSGGISAIALKDNEVYVGGSYLSSAGGVTTYGPAKWNGSAWSALGSGLTTSPGTPSINALTFIGNDLFVGGRFIFAGDKPSMFIARWNDQLNFYPEPKPRLTKRAFNANKQFQFRVTGTSGEPYMIQTSTNLQEWLPLLTNTAVGYDFLDPAATNFQMRAYRAVLAP